MPQSILVVVEVIGGIFHSLMLLTLLSLTWYTTDNFIMPQLTCGNVRTVYRNLACKELVRTGSSEQAS